MQTKSTVRKKNNKAKTIRYIIAVAATAALIFIIFWGYNFYALSADRLFKEKYRVFEIKKTNVPGDTIMNAIEVAYNKKNYQAVVDLKKKAANLSAKDYFLAGVSYLEINDPANAIVSFKAAINLNKSSAEQVYEDESEFYLSLAYLKNKDFDQALELMAAIHDNSHHLYHEYFPKFFIQRVKMLKWR
jgi:tetratricopeptide (TPR) repeat protein